MCSCSCRGPFPESTRRAYSQLPKTPAPDQLHGHVHICAYLYINTYIHVQLKTLFKNLVLTKRNGQASSQWHICRTTHHVTTASTVHTHAPNILHTPLKPFAPCLAHSWPDRVCLAKHSNSSFTLNHLQASSKVFLSSFTFLFLRITCICVGACSTGYRGPEGALDPHGVINRCDQPSLSPLPEVCTRARPFPSPVHCNSSNHLL